MENSRKKVYGNLWKKAMALTLAAAMGLSMAACGKGKETGAGLEESGTASERKEFVWVPEFRSLDGESGSFYRVQMVSDYLYYENYGWDETTMESSYSIESLSILDGSKGKSFSIEVNAGENGNRNVNQFVPDADGKLYTVEDIWNWNETTGESSRETYVCKYDADGAQLFETNLSEQVEQYDTDNYVQNMVVDEKGRIYLSYNSKVRLVDENGKYSGEIAVGGGMDTWINSLGVGKDGKVYVASNDYTGGSVKVSLSELNFEGRSVAKSYNDFRGTSGNTLLPSLNKDFLCSDEAKLYEYDLATETTEEVLDWMDCDINGNTVVYAGMLADDKVIAVVEDWESNATDLVTLTKKRADEVVQKQELVLAALYSDSSVRSAAIQFNKGSERYHITMRTYFDYMTVGDDYVQGMSDAIKRMNSDITSANCPDMVVLEGLSVEQLANKGAFEDLIPYLEKSTSLSREDYMENILEAYTLDGRLVTIPRSFSLMTLAGKTSEVGAKPGWNLDAILAYAKQHPGAQLLNYNTKASTLQMLIQYNQGSFIDWTAGKCHFDGEEFIKLLEFANQFPEEYQWEEDEPSEPTQIAAGNVLLSQVYLYDLRSIQEAEGKFGEPVTFIGYPNSDGDSGCYLNASSKIAILSKSKNKEGAWEFIESSLNKESSMYDFGFPTKKSEYESKIQQALKIEYILDPEGNPYLDEDGEPLIAGSGGSIGYGDGWTYKYHHPTQEEADKLAELIKSAKPIRDADTVLLQIITEEAEGYFKGQKSARDVAGIIQGRAQLYVDENR